ncbi:MAG: tetratricopeptide repeat protein, partial [Caldilineaceae bacterium]|nr:tetratricopeptide repeat protein [Caldilineaceae bacterium]
MNTLEIDLLGAPIIQLNRQPVTFESRKATALLAYLAMSGKPHQRSELATLLWPDSDNKRARGALRYTLSILQGALGKEWLQSDRATIGLAGDTACTVDARQFQELLTSGRDHLHTPDTVCLNCIQPINDAVALYRDDFLTGFGLRDSVNFDEWQFFRREGFRHQLVNALRRLIRFHTQQADYQQALISARRLLQLDPLQESVQREAMQLYAHSGQWELALRQYDECVRLLEAELSVPPSPATTQLFEQIRGQRLGAVQRPTTSQTPASVTFSPSARPHNLPAATMPILGREPEIAAIRALLNEPHCRMVTLLGPGGIGKTRLAHQVAIDLCHAPEAHFARGVYFVPLTAVESADLLVTAIANALELPFNGPKAPQAQLRQYLREQHFLLVLDNFEQLVSSAPLLAELLNAAHGLKLLITSRERLNLHEEWLYEAQGLPLPPLDAHESSTALKANGCVQLFYHQARRLEPRFDLDEALPAIVQIAHMLQGMPLGLELAAGWVRTFSCTEIARQIQHDLDFLATPAQNVAQRHRSLRAAFLHSWRRLDEAERTVFAKAALFRGGFSLDAAAAVTGANPLTLGALVDKSMVQHLRQRQPAQDRYTIHELLRQYAEETLEPAVRHAVQRLHCAYFGAFVQKQMPHRGLASEDDALRAIGVELENIRAAWSWLLQQIPAAHTDAARQFQATQIGQFVPMLAHYYLRLSRFEEGEKLFQDAGRTMQQADWSAHDGEVPQQSAAFILGQVQARLAEFAFNLSRFHEVADTYEALLPLLRQAGHADELGAALTGLGKAFIRMGRYADAEPLLQESVALFRGTQEPTGLTGALNSLGILYSNQGRFEQARPLYEEFLLLARANQHVRGKANALNNLGSNYARAGQHQKALPLYEECHRLALVSGERLVIAVALSNLGSVSRALNRYADARRYYAESLAICREIGDRRWTTAGLNGLGLTLIADGALSEAIPHLREALTTAQEIESTPDMLDALAALGEIILNQGNAQRAAAILHFVHHHPITQTLARQRSGE